MKSSYLCANFIEMEEKIVLFVPKSAGTLVERLGDLYRQICDVMNAKQILPDHLLWARAYLSDAVNQVESIRQHSLYKEILSKGAFSYVQQAPLCGCKVALIMSFVLEGKLIKEGNPSQCIIHNNETDYYYQSVRLTASEAASLSVKEQTKECFRRHITWLKANELTLRDNCMRTWLYVRDIDYNYHSVVEGRNEVFRSEGLTPTTHFIASTGIGGMGDNAKAVVGIDFFSVGGVSSKKVKYLQAPEFLNPTYQYGVAFERGTLLQIGDQQRLFISGTASIDKNGECVYLGDVHEQTERLLLNIDQLLADGGSSLQELRLLIVYLRDVSDYELVNKYLKQRFPKLAILVTYAPVCRPQWLIEAEGLVIK